MFIGRTDAEAETPILWPPDAKTWLIGKDPDAGRDWGQEKKGTTEDEMVGWHHQLDGHEFGWTPGVGDGQGGLACCGSWGCRVGHDWATEQNWIRKKMFSNLYSHKKFLYHWPIVRILSSVQWCHPTISSSVVPFSSCLQLFPASGSFLVSQFFPSGGQSNGVSASASVLPMNIQDIFRI